MTVTGESWAIATVTVNVAAIVVASVDEASSGLLFLGLGSPCLLCCSLDFLWNVSQVCPSPPFSSDPVSAFLPPWVTPVVESYRAPQLVKLLDNFLDS